MTRVSQHLLCLTACVRFHLFFIAFQVHLQDLKFLCQLLQFSPHSIHEFSSSVIQFSIFELKLINLSKLHLRTHHLHNFLEGLTLANYLFLDLIFYPHLFSFFTSFIVKLPQLMNSSNHFIQDFSLFSDHLDQLGPTNSHVHDFLAK